MRPLRNLTWILILGVAPLDAQVPARPAPARSAPVPPPAVGLTLKEVRESFTKADADRNGALTAAESVAGGLDAVGFSAADADGDQKLSEEEFIVGSEARASKLAGGAAADLTAESTRVQALRRAKKAEELKTHRDVPAPGSARPENQAGATTISPAAPTAAAGVAPSAPAGPAAARKAIAPESPDAKQESLAEIRASIVRRLRNGEISEEKAREEMDTIDRRIANATGGQVTSDSGQAKAAGTAVVSGPSGTANPNHELRAIEETLARRLRNSEIDPAKAQELYGATVHRIESARGATPPAQEPGQANSPAVPEGIRARIAEAQLDLSRRLRNAKVTPEQAALEEAALAKRLRNSVESLKTGAAGQTATSSDAAASTSAASEKASGSSVVDPSKTPQAPARARPDGTTSSGSTPAAGSGGAPARRPSDSNAPASSGAAPARGSTQAPAAQPASNPPATAPEKDRGETKPARPAPATSKPATPPAGGGGKP